jgi:hypothetical protein
MITANHNAPHRRQQWGTVILRFKQLWSRYQIIETVITSGLTDRAAYRLESRMIGEFHKFRAGQLWNTIDERFLDPRYLPEEWDDPECPLYRLPRPLGNPQLTRGWARSKTYQLWASVQRARLA